MTDAGVGVTIASAYIPDRRERATRLLSDYIDKAEAPNYLAIVRLVDLLRAGRSFSQAFAIVERFKATAEDPGFHVSWARLVAAQNNRALVRQLLEDKTFRQDAVRTKEPVTLYRLLKVGEIDVPLSLLTDAIELAISAGDFAQLREMADVFHDEGRFDEFESKVRGRVPTHLWDDFTDTAHRRRRYRFGR